MCGNSVVSGNHDKIKKDSAGFSILVGDSKIGKCWLLFQKI